VSVAGIVRWFVVEQAQVGVVAEQPGASLPGDLAEQPELLKAGHVPVRGREGGAEKSP
jgi:hypothetical protein